MSALESQVRNIENYEALDGWAGFARTYAHRFLVEPPVVDQALGGAWLGHPLHPVVATVPLGAFALSTMLDVAGGEKYADAVDALTTTGILTGLAAAVVGAHDLGLTEGGATRIGVIHAASNDLAVGCFIAASRARRQGNRGRGRAWAVAGVAAAGAGAYLGGHLVYRLGVGVDR